MLKAERDFLLHRLKQPDGDEELEYAMDRLFRNFYQLWQPLREYQEDPSKLEEWRRAEKPTAEWAKGVFFQEALKVLSLALYG